MVGQEKIIEKLKKMKMNYLKQERGSILVLSVILLPILFAFLGFGYDFGNIYMHKSRLQNVADAAALAGARAYLDSQATEDKDKIDGTVDRANGKLTADSSSSDKTGRTTEYEYVPGVVTDYNHCNSGSSEDVLHPRADEAADEYINKNIINLGSKVKSDRWSHYAINSDGTNPKTFYRIGLYEEVPLYFLPIIKSVKSPQTVRAGAIALVVPGTTGTTTTTNPTEPSYSIFDNLYTYSERLFMQNNVNFDGTIKSTFTGKISYTHQNGLQNGVPKSVYYEESAPGPGDNANDNPNSYVFSSGGNSGSANVVINDPEIDTTDNTVAYVKAFKDKLNRPHVDVNQKKLTPDYINNPIVEVKIDGYPVREKQEGSSKILYLDRGDKDYFLVDSETNNYLLVEGNRVQYRELPESYGNKSIRGFESNGKFYLLNKNNQKSDLYIDLNTNKIYQGNTEVWTRNYDGLYIPLDDQGNEKQGISADLYDIIDRNNYFQPQNNPQYIASASNSGGGEDVFYVTLSNLPDGNFELNIDKPLTGDVNKPVYIIVDETIEQNVKISGNGGSDGTTRRPIIFVYLGNKEIEFVYTGEFKGTVYAPYAEFWAQSFNNTYTGNVIANVIRIQADKEATWISHNYLTGDADIADAVDTIRLKVQAEKAALSEETKTAIYNELAQAIRDEIVQNGSDGEKARLYGKLFPEKYNELYEILKSEWKDNVRDHPEAQVAFTELTEAQRYKWPASGANVYENLYNRLTETEKGLLGAKLLENIKSNLGNTEWYNNFLTYLDKNSFYTAWKEIYNQYKNTEYKDLLWPWNDHFNIRTEPSDEVLRLINFRTDFQEKNLDGTENTGEKDPFIYLSLDKENAY